MTAPQITPERCEELASGIELAMEGHDNAYIAIHRSEANDTLAVLRAYQPLIARETQLNDLCAILAADLRQEAEALESVLQRPRESYIDCALRSAAGLVDRERLTPVGG